MITYASTFSSFSVDSLEKATVFYGDVLGLPIEETEEGLSVTLKNGANLFIYEKPTHVPASFTVLNFIVDDIDDAADELKDSGVELERYDMGEMQPDEKGIYRGSESNDGPDIAWFEDPAGNILSIVSE